MYKTKLLFIIIMLFGLFRTQGAVTGTLVETKSEFAANPPCSPIPGPKVGDTGCIEFVYNGKKVQYTTVRGTDGYVWLQQNLGSSAVASSEVDVNAYGDYFQWGRWDDGHQLANSLVQNTSLKLNDPTGLVGGNPNFIASTPGWWNAGTNVDSWAAESVKLVTENDGCDPCKALGAGWTMPTESDWKDVISTFKNKDIQNAFDSFLKLTVGGSRGSNGNFNFVGLRGYYWSNTTSSNLNLAKHLYYSNAIMNASAGAQRSLGAAVRCILKINEAITNLKVTVPNNAAAKIKIYQGTLALDAAVYPINQSQDVNWSIVSGNAFATVDTNGVLTAIASGLVTVRATSVENPSVFDEIIVEITNQIPPCNTLPGTTTGDTGCVTFTYNGETVQYTTIRAADGNVWLQQNLGSTAVATAENDNEGYGDLFQWGRWDDGHQLRTSTVGIAGVGSDPSLIVKGNNEFLSGWWNTGDSEDQWNAADISVVDHTNGCDPCRALGAGWSIPTEDQWKNIVSSEHITNISTAFDSNLKLTIAGTRNGNNFSFEGVRGLYWSKTAAANLNFGKSLYYSNFIVNPSAGYPREQGQSVRCVFNLHQVVTSVQVQVKNNTAPIITVPNGTLDLEAIVLPVTGNQLVYWKVVSGFGVATINSNGRITALADGKVTLRAVSVEDSKVYGDLEVTVALVLPCVEPKLLTIDNITPVSAVANWSGSGDAFEYELRVSGNVGSGSNGLISTGETAAFTLPLSGLLPNTVYTIYIRTKCGSDSTSEWTTGTSFTTLCQSVSTPNVTDQVYCGPKTVADLIVTGVVNASFKWYSTNDPKTVLDLKTPLSSGSYQVIQVLDGCESLPQSIEVTVFDLPKQPTVKTPQVLSAGSVIKDILITDEINPIWYASLDDAKADKNRLANNALLATDTNYYVVNQSVAGCFSEVSEVKVTLTLKSNDFNKDALRYFPNPTNDFIVVDYNETIVSYIIFDMQGRQLNKQIVNSTNFKISFALYPAGVYLVDLQTISEKEIIRIIKK